MKERLLQLMQSLGMNPTQFAQATGIQRATLQHVLSGRNDASLPIVMSICKAYPKLNVEWLIFGRGTLYSDSLPHQGRQTGTVDPVDETLIFSMEEMGARKNQNLSEVEDSGKNRQIQQTDDTPRQALAPDTRKPQPVSAGQNASDSKKTGHNIKEVVIFFDDGTYEIFSYKS